MPATKSLRSGTWASTLLPMMRSARLPSATSSAASLRPKKSTRVGMPLSIATLATLAAGSMPSTGTPSGSEVLQQVAVVARELDDQAVRAEAQPLRDRLAVALGVRNPGGRVGGEVGVLPEDVLGADVLLELHQEALPAHQRMQRKVGLHGVELLADEKALAQRRHAEVDERALEAGAAQAARSLGRAVGSTGRVHSSRIHAGPAMAKT